MVWLWAMARAATCAAYGEPEQRPAVDLPGQAESSGVAASRVHDGLFYTHGDDGVPELYGFDLQGRRVATYAIPDAELDDWEDIAAAPCPDQGDCLYVGDIGDNDASRPNVSIYVVREPDSPDDDRLKLVERITAVYPDGPVDAETLLVHACTGRIHVVTKADDGLSVIYRLPFDPGRDTVAFEEVGRVEVEGTTAQARAVTGGDWDVDGERLVLRTATRILEWATDPDAPQAHWGVPPRVLVAANEREGEGIAFDLDGGLVTTSEGAPMPVATLSCDESSPPASECVFPQTGGCGCAHGAGPGAALAGPTMLALLRRRRR